MSRNVSSFDVNIDGANAQDVIVVVLQPVAAALVGTAASSTRGQPAPAWPPPCPPPVWLSFLAVATSMFADADRDDLVAGRARPDLFTRQKLLGDAAPPVVLDRGLAGATRADGSPRVS